MEIQRGGPRLDVLVALLGFLLTPFFAVAAALVAVAAAAVFALAAIVAVVPVVGPLGLLAAGQGNGRRRGGGVGRLEVEQGFEADELVTVLLQDGRREGLASDDEDGLAVFLQLVDQRNEVAVAADNGESVHVVVGEGHLERIQRQVDVRAVLVAARRRDPLDHLNGIFGHLARCALLTAPVRVGELGDQVSALLERFQYERHVEFAPQCRFDADFNVVVVDKHGDIQSFLHHVAQLRPSQV